MPRGKRIDLNEDNIVFPSDSNHVSKITCCGRLSVIEIINNCLTISQKRLFSESCFGHFLKMHEIKFSSAIVHKMLKCMDVRESAEETKMQFTLGTKTVTFDMLQFGLITGLKMEGNVDESLIPNDHRLTSRYWPNKTVLERVDLENKVKSKSYDNDEDAVCVALVYFLNYFLLGKQAHNQIKMWTMMLASSSLEAFNHYPWGRVSWDMTVPSYKHALQYICNDTFTLFGCPLVLQVWVYEIIPRFEKKGYITRKDNDKRCMLNWETRGAHMKDTVLQKMIFDRLHKIKIRLQIKQPGVVGRLERKIKESEVDQRAQVDDISLTRRDSNIDVSEVVRDLQVVEGQQAREGKVMDGDSVGDKSVPLLTTLCCLRPSFGFSQFTPSDDDIGSRIMAEIGSIKGLLMDVIVPKLENINSRLSRLERIRVHDEVVGKSFYHCPSHSCPSEPVLGSISPKHQRRRLKKPRTQEIVRDDCALMQEDLVERFEIPSCADNVTLEGTRRVEVPARADGNTAEENTALRL